MTLITVSAWYKTDSICSKPENVSPNPCIESGTCVPETGIKDMDK